MNIVPMSICFVFACITCLLYVSVSRESSPLSLCVYVCVFLVKLPLFPFPVMCDGSLHHLKGLDTVPVQYLSSAEREMKMASNY